MTTPFPYLRLPREIRDEIYIFLFSDLVFDRNNPQDRSEHEKKSSIDPRLALLLRFEPEPDARGFHVGALLGLFPGLELDLLVLEDGMSSGLSGYEAAHGPDLVESLLQADGFREVRANIRAAEDAFAGNRRMDGTRGGCGKDFDDYGSSWAESIRTRFRGRPGWSVDLYVEEAACPSVHWDGFRDAGVTVRDGLEQRQDAGLEESEDRCFLAENYWTFRACRGDGPVAVPDAGRDRVLGCIGYYFQEEGPLSDEEVKGASDGLRQLFRDRNYAQIVEAEEVANLCADGPYEYDW
ncbi:hypothetical protein PG997_000013 [Apiospora hydei]|uniref:Uncharacterized protein n=1 Tax=Apiospora hydei TaxID=1337664 RepID=A0ABR1X9N7_9PEZI